VAVHVQTVNNNAAYKITNFLKKFMTFLFISVYTSIKFIMLYDLYSCDALFNALLSIACLKVI
jgi:hypothetical protein